MDCCLKQVALKATHPHAFGVKKVHPSQLREVIATNVRRVRAMRGLSQEDLAHESGINRSYLSDVERAQRNLSIDNLDRLAQALGVEAWTLLRPEQAADQVPV
jgi:transcriptional regulator with XRE-family HTH domain